MNIEMVVGPKQALVTPQKSHILVIWTDTDRFVAPKWLKKFLY